MALTALDRFIEKLREAEPAPAFSSPVHVHATASEAAPDKDLKRDPKRDPGFTLPTPPGLEAGQNCVVYFTFEGGSTESARSPRLAMAESPCPACGGRAWWRSIHGALVCVRCHPPVSAAVVADWLGGHDA
jgi:hypothetical protein